MSAYPGLRVEGLARRRRINRVMEVLAWLAALIGMAILGVVVWSVAQQGLERAEPRPADEAADSVQPDERAAGPVECVRRAHS